MRAREEGKESKEEKPMTLKEVETALEGEQEVTDSQVRAALSAEAENVMNTSVPTPTPADLEAIIKGEKTFDEKEEHEVPEMPSLGAQQELLDQAVPDEPLPPAGSGEPATAPPVNRDVPLVMGDGIVGATLNCTMGNWENEPTGYEYAWQTDGSPNSATGATYNVPAGDAGKQVSCIVTATNALGSTVAPVSNVVSIGAATREMTAGENGPGYQTRVVPKR